MRHAIHTLLFAAFIAAIALAHPSATAQSASAAPPHESTAPPLAAGQTVSVSNLRTPSKASQHLVRAYAASRIHREAECDKELDAALKIYPAYPEAFQFRAARELSFKDYLSARRDALAALDSDPNILWAPVILASAYNGLHQYADAALLLQNLHGPAAATWQAQYEIARAETGLNHTESALAASASALARAPASSKEVHLIRANALAAAQRDSEAIAQLDAFLASLADPASRPDLTATRTRLIALSAQQNSTTELAATNAIEH